MHEDLIRARLDRNTQYKPGKALKIFYTFSNEYNFQIGVHHFDWLNDTTKTSCVVFFPRLKFVRLWLNYWKKYQDKTSPGPWWSNATPRSLRALMWECYIVSIWNVSFHLRPKHSWQSWWALRPWRPWGAVGTWDQLRVDIPAMMRVLCGKSNYFCLTWHRGAEEIPHSHMLMKRWKGCPAKRCQEDPVDLGNYRWGWRETLVKTKILTFYQVCSVFVTID